MTDDDKRQQRAMLLLECQEAEQDFGQLSEKARKLTDALRIVIGHLEDARTDLNATRKPEKPVKPIFELPILRDALDAEEIENLICELFATRERVADLRSRKIALGLK